MAWHDEYEERRRVLRESARDAIYKLFGSPNPLDEAKPPGDTPAPTGSSPSAPAAPPAKAKPKPMARSMGAKQATPPAPAATEPAATSPQRKARAKQKAGAPAATPAAPGSPTAAAEAPAASAPAPSPSAPAPSPSAPAPAASSPAAADAPAASAPAAADAPAAKASSPAAPAASGPAKPDSPRVIPLTAWMVSGKGEVRWLVGDDDEGIDRSTSQIMSYDPKTRIAKTKSGSQYHLEGSPHPAYAKHCEKEGKDPYDILGLREVQWRDTAAAAELPPLPDIGTPVVPDETEEDKAQAAARGALERYRGKSAEALRAQRAAAKEPAGLMSKIASWFKRSPSVVKLDPSTSAYKPKDLNNDKQAFARREIKGTLPISMFGDPRLLGKPGTLPASSTQAGAIPKLIPYFPNGIPFTATIEPGGRQDDGSVSRPAVYITLPNLLVPGSVNEDMARLVVNKSTVNNIASMILLQLQKTGQLPKGLAQRADLKMRFATKAADKIQPWAKMGKERAAQLQRSMAPQERSRQRAETRAHNARVAARIAQQQQYAKRAAASTPAPASPTAAPSPAPAAPSPAPAAPSPAPAAAAPAAAPAGDDYLSRMQAASGTRLEDIDHTLEAIFESPLAEDKTYDKHKAWRRKNKQKVRDQNARARKRKGYKDKHAARQRTYAARKAGKMSKPESCSRCHKHTDKLEFDHNKGYKGDNKNKGRWLCTGCHMKIQKRFLIKKAMN